MNIRNVEFDFDILRAADADRFQQAVNEMQAAAAAVPKAGGGSSLAAAFLEEFVPEGTPWIHLDIAGSAETEKGCAYAQKGASGVMIETLVHLLARS